MININLEIFTKIQANAFWPSPSSLRSLRHLYCVLKMAKAEKLLLINTFT